MGARRTGDSGPAAHVHGDWQFAPSLSLHLGGSGGHSLSPNYNLERTLLGISYENGEAGHIVVPFSVDLLSVARSALTEGDDLHNRLSSATQVLHAVLSTRQAESPAAQAALATVLAAPLYFLNLWMPACALMLDAAAGVAGSTIVTSMTANGETTGVRIAGLGGRCFTAPANLVRGPFMKGVPEHPRYPPATGDSGIIDAYGLGGQVLHRAPSLQAAFEPWLAPDDSARARGMLAGLHAVLGVAFGIDATTVAASGRTPLLSTGMVSADGRGLLGRGVCEMPLEPFVEAVRDLKLEVAK